MFYYFVGYVATSWLGVSFPASEEGFGSLAWDKMVSLFKKWYKLKPVVFILDVFSYLMQKQFELLHTLFGVGY